MADALGPSSSAEVEIVGASKRVLLRVGQAIPFAIDA